VSNQASLQFGPAAALHTLLRVPLGTLAGASLLGLCLVAVRSLVQARPWQRGASLDATVTGDLAYLAVVLAAACAAAYYEGFLYSPLVVPVVVALLARGAASLAWARPLLWAAAAIWALNAAQQIVTFRALLGAA
jgi:hypothetical protein